MLKQTDAWGAIFTPTVVAHQVLASALPLLLAIGFRNTAAAGLTSHAFGSLVVGLGCAILGLHALVLYGYLDPKIRHS